ncbi:MAG: DUF4282 domain-containing protein [Chlorobium limicola]|nr:DUF4282 domain-containing protein [Chlorobium limicola]
MDKESFFGKLFDFSFKEFITLQLIKYLYIIGIIFAAITALGALIGGFSAMKYDFGKGIFSVLMSPVVFILITVVVRLGLEAIVATFRIAENTSKMVENSRREP